MEVVRELLFSKNLTVQSGSNNRVHSTAWWPLAGNTPHIWWRGENETLHVMATHGKINEFDPSHEAWATYVERLEFYFIANGIEDPEKKRDY